MDHPIITNMERTGTPDGRMESSPLCAVCCGEFHADELTEYVGDNLCDDCLESRVQANYNLPDGMEYISAHPDFFTDWFGSLSELTRLDYLKKIFEDYKLRRPMAAAEDIKEYCFQNDYVKWRVEREGGF